MEHGIILILLSPSPRPCPTLSFTHVVFQHHFHFTTTPSSSSFATFSDTKVSTRLKLDNKNYPDFHRLSLRTKGCRDDVLIKLHSKLLVVVITWNYGHQRVLSWLIWS